MKDPLEEPRVAEMARIYDAIHDSRQSEQEALRERELILHMASRIFAHGMRGIGSALGESITSVSSDKLRRIQEHLSQQSVEAALQLVQVYDDWPEDDDPDDGEEVAAA